MTQQPQTHVLVTGCAGFIGANVAQLLLERGAAVTGVDNMNDAYDPRMKEWRLARLHEHPRFTFHRMDIADRFAVDALFARMGANGAATAVAHLAARAGVRDSLLDPWTYYETNVTGTLNVLDACRCHGLRKLVLASTSSLYGDVNELPFLEDDDTDHPLSPYAASKKGAEALGYAYHHAHGLDVTALRFFTVYGPAGRPDMSIFRFVGWIAEGRPVRVFGDGHQRRDFTYVDDIARGVVGALELTGHQTINLGGDAPVELMEVIRRIESLLGKQATLQFEPAQAADVRATWADISEARRLLNWEPQVTLEEGLHATVEWFQENREWAAAVLP